MRSSFLFKNACRFGGFVNNFSNSAFSSFIFCLSFSLSAIYKKRLQGISLVGALPQWRRESFPSVASSRPSTNDGLRYPVHVFLGLLTLVYHACASRARRDENVRRRERKRQKRTSLDPPPPNNQKEGGKVPFYTHLCLWRDGWGRELVKNDDFSRCLFFWCVLGQAGQFNLSRPAR